MAESVFAGPGTAELRKLVDDSRTIRRLTWCIALMTAIVLVLTVILVLKG
jgi:hypothetical protein